MKHRHRLRRLGRLAEFDRFGHALQRRDLQHGHVGIFLLAEHLGFDHLLVRLAAVENHRDRGLTRGQRLLNPPQSDAVATAQTRNETHRLQDSGFRDDVLIGHDQGGISAGLDHESGARQGQWTDGNLDVDGRLFEFPGGFRRERLIGMGGLGRDHRDESGRDQARKTLHRKLPNGDRRRSAQDRPRPSDLRRGWSSDPAYADVPCFDNDAPTITKETSPPSSPSHTSNKFIDSPMDRR